LTSTTSPEAAIFELAQDDALFPSEDERGRLGSLVSDTLANSRNRIRNGSTTPTFDPDAFRRELAAFDFSSCRSPEKVLSWTIGQLEDGIVHTTHPRYFGLFNPAPTFPAECADRIAATFNPQLAAWKTSPAAVEIERHVIQAVGRRSGLGGDVHGHFTVGGAEANFTALLCALTHANSEYAAAGARAFSAPPVVYVSRECHLAWIKIAHQAGIGRKAVRFVPTDGTGRLDVAALQQLIFADLGEGFCPVMVIATAGTTNAGMIDPLRECAQIARQHQLWYHVDAAWGGALIASERSRHELSGIDLADSVTIDAHKWFATTMGCGMFMTPHSAALSSVFDVSADFMPSSLTGLDPYMTSLQWSRRFAGLRLFLSLAVAGWQGYAAHIERAIALAALLRDSLIARHWLIANTSRMAVLCALPPQGSASPKSVVERVLRSGRAWVSTATFEGKEVIRACITNGTSRSDDIAELVDALESAL
jgi:glutamate/tyrosine decarboxylase-like PLP-dependent enzyme